MNKLSNPFKNLLTDKPQYCTKKFEENTSSWNPFVIPNQNYPLLQENRRNSNLFKNNPFVSCNDFEQFLKETEESKETEQEHNEQNEIHQLEVDLKYFDRKIKKYTEMIHFFISRKEFDKSTDFNELLLLEKQKAEEKRIQIVTLRLKNYLKAEQNQIDFNFFKINEAKKALHEIFDNAILHLRKNQEFQKTLKFITGRGKHSINEIANIKLMVMTESKNRGLIPIEVHNNEGVLNF
ncbi:hypothetical protein PVAND_007583 [Polypedilum vanderplanki]|uniref:Smr domain-containing protein n=1 Tax=Polypedilum vanderplanki TaxID=319348 RepID=A0A9J6C7D5_POLVA|nr:hypothetical protein PVAND_007583 [Polypedilum vanderplanki]